MLRLKWRVIDFSINGLCKENRFRSQRTTTTYKINVYNSKLIDLVIRIKLTQAILMPGSSNFLRNSIIHFRMFSYLMFSESFGYVAIPVTNGTKDAGSDLSVSN